MEHLWQSFEEKGEWWGIEFDSEDGTPLIMDIYIKSQLKKICRKNVILLKMLKRRILYEKIINISVKHYFH